MKQIKVFISSTFRDMQTERDTLMYQVAPRVNNALSKHGIHVQFVDLRWGVDTDNCSESEQDHHVLNRCIDEIRQSRPFFIGILGDRYGWIPSESTWQQTMQQLNEAEASQVLDIHQTPASVTELEIILGAMMDKQLLRRSLFLFRNFTSDKEDIISQQADYMDNDPLAIDKLQTLKTRIQTMMSDQMLQKHIVDYEAAYQTDKVVLTDTFTNQVVDFLIREITLHELSSVSPKEESTIFDEVLDMEKQFEQKHTSCFQGRSETLLAIHDKLNKESPTVLVGHAGTGRSALMAQYKTLVEEVTEFIVLTHYAEVCTQNFSPDFMWRKWIYQMSRIVKMPPVPNEIDMSQKELQTYLNRMIQQADTGVVLIIDGLEQLIDCDGLQSMQEAVSNAQFICTLEAQYVMSIAHLAQSEQVHPIFIKETINNDDIQAIIHSFSQVYSKEINPIVIQALLEKYEDEHHCAAQPIWLHSMLHQLIYFTAEDYAAIDALPANSPMEQIIQYQLQLIQNAQGYPESLFSQRFFSLPPHMNDVKLIVHILGMAPRGILREDLMSMLASAGINATLAISNALSWFGDMITEYAYDGRIKLAHSCLIGEVLQQDMQVVEQIYDVYLTKIKKDSETKNEVNSLILDAFTDLLIKGLDVDPIPALFDTDNSDYFRAVDRVYWLMHKKTDHVFTWLNKGLEVHPVITAHIVCSLIRKMRHTGEDELANKLLYTVSDTLNSTEFASGELHELRINTLIDYANGCLAHLEGEQEDDENNWAQSVMQIANDVLSCAMEEEESAHTSLRTQHRALSLGYMAGVHNMDSINQNVLQHFLGKSIEIGDQLIAQKDFSIIEQHVANTTSIYYLSNQSGELADVEEYAGYVRYYHSTAPSVQLQYEKIAARYTSGLLYQFIEAQQLADTMFSFIVDELSDLQGKHEFLKFDKLMIEIGQESEWSKGSLMPVTEVDEQDLIYKDDFVRHLHALWVSHQDYETLWHHASWTIEERISMGIWAYMHHYHEVGQYIYTQLKQFEEATQQPMPPVEWCFLSILPLYFDDDIDGGVIAEKAMQLYDLIQENNSSQEPQEAPNYTPEYYLANRFVSLFFGLTFPINDETIEYVWSYVNAVLTSQFQTTKTALHLAKQTYQRDTLLYGEAYLNVDAQMQHLALYEDIVRIFARITGEKQTIKDKTIYTQTIERLSLIMTHFDNSLLDRYGYYNTHRKAYEILSDCHETIEQYTESMLYLQKNKDILYEVCQLHPDNTTLIRDYAIALDHIANWLLQQHNDKEAAYKYIQRAAPIFEHLYQENPERQFDNYLVNQYIKLELDVHFAKDKSRIQQIIQEIYALIEQIKRDAQYACSPNNKIAMLLDTISDAYHKMGDEASMITTLQQAQSLFKSIYLEAPQDGPGLRDYLKSSYRMMLYVENVDILLPYYATFMKEYNSIVTIAPQDMQLRTLMVWLMIQEKVMALHMSLEKPYWEDIVEIFKEVTQAIASHITTRNNNVLKAWQNILCTTFAPLEQVVDVKELTQEAYASYASIFKMELKLKRALLDQSIYTWNELDLDTTLTNGFKLDLLD